MVRLHRRDKVAFATQNQSHVSNHIMIVCLKGQGTLNMICALSMAALSMAALSMAALSMAAALVEKLGTRKTMSLPG